ncbi:MAG: hypothetical protein COV95_00520 [Candidatus Zambryskibacteria bacterium CG11_big_fil_rev_8_21_14_0_20_40_24]|uniref:Uncharacterized protein n=1 Tax=Candidatus Zambryskibacteria bacterium CG11_big_fil_rev_8_21_14_0_20_40_24 TaxID=1975116 RepID=A0A2H0K792_9BACT|nr:MAG: hypothetical protein COV95_00520 [Candidatus Zambryskibacteria bacterium CG11_big_fil_rev_8_21_14_0_20_40_24]
MNQTQAKGCDVAELFPSETPSLMPITFNFGEPVNYGQEIVEMATSFAGEETITRPGGGYDTGA